MMLLGVKKTENGQAWLYSKWRLTYRVGRSRICGAASLIYEYTKDPEIIDNTALRSSLRKALGYYGRKHYAF